MVNDPIADMLIQIKNASMVGKQRVELPYSNLKQAVAKILKEEGYVASVETVDEGPKKRLRIAMKYEDKTPALSGVKRISKPGLRQYVSRRTIPEVLGGMGTAILSTPQGIMSGKEAKKRGVGGELLCEVW